MRGVIFRELPSLRRLLAYETRKDERRQGEARGCRICRLDRQMFTLQPSALPSIDCVAAAAAVMRCDAVLFMGSVGSLFWCSGGIGYVRRAEPVCPIMD